jgi:hypothetical protein
LTKRWRWKLQGRFLPAANAGQHQGRRIKARLPEPPADLRQRLRNPDAAGNQHR